MGNGMRKENSDVLQSDVTNEGQFSGVYTMSLLFLEKPVLPQPQAFHKALCGRFGNVDVVTQDGGFSAYALCDHLGVYQGGQKLPSQLFFTEAAPFDPESVSALTRGQFWDVEDGEQYVNRCTYEVKYGDFMAGILPYKERSQILLALVELMLSLYPGCSLLYFPKSGKLLTPEGWAKNPYEGEQRFLHGGMNLRLFRVQGKEEEQIVDTLGLYALGLPDIQCHFHSLPPEDVVRGVCDVAAYVFREGDIIGDGETVPGLGGEEYCRCRHEMGIVEPQRQVLDLNEGRYAAGNRK